MSIHLDPLIKEKLNAFAKRRRRLIVMRGVFSAVAMLLLTMLIIAGIDLSVRMADWVRWTLSGAAYLIVFIIAWRQCLTWLLHAPDARQLARLVEHAEPKLREDLLSAVELGEAHGKTFDSEQFRELLQHDVAHRMEGIEVTNLLPVSLIKRYITYSVVILVLVGAMVAITGWKFPTLLLRALFPGANLERISRTQVLIREPKGGDIRVPQGDTVRVRVELKGERASKAFIITDSQKDGWQAAEMLPIGKDEFAASVNVGRESIRYRIEAGDAVTRYYTLDARERPFVQQYEKTYRYPKYTNRPDKTVTETDGGLVAIEGTEVELKLKLNQAVESGELRLEQGKSSSAIKLTQAPDGRLVARVPLNVSGSYRVHLVGADTKFDNRFSPENELRAEPDLVPSVELISPKEDLLLPSNEFVDITGSAKDDLGLAKVSQLVKVNESAWKETELVKAPGLKTAIEHHWDLYPMSVKPGDLLTMKLVATDLKGNKGESRPLQITVTAAGLDMRRLLGVDSLRELNLATHALGQSSEVVAKASLN